MDDAFRQRAGLEVQIISRHGAFDGEEMTVTRSYEGSLDRQCSDIRLTSLHLCFFQGHWNSEH